MRFYIKSYFLIRQIISINCYLRSIFKINKLIKVDENGRATRSDRTLISLSGFIRAKGEGHLAI